MGGHRPIELYPRDPAERIDRIGEVEDMVVDIGPEAFVVGCRRPKEEVAAPQGPEIEIQLALRVDEEGAAPLLLEYREAVLALQGEISGERIVVAAIGLGAEIAPAA